MLKLVSPSKFCPTTKDDDIYTFLVSLPSGIKEYCSFNFCSIFFNNSFFSSILLLSIHSVLALFASSNILLSTPTISNILDISGIYDCLIPIIAIS